MQPWLLAQELTETYVVCFSAIDDLVTQWNTYGSRGSGFSIGFDRKKMAGTIQPPPSKPARTWDEAEIQPLVRLAKVTYSEELQKREFRRVFDAYHNEAVTAASSPEEIKECARELVDNAANSACYFKHHCFKHEKEWRIVVATLSGCSNLNFRSSARTIIPYLKIPLEKKVLPIVSVTIGPTLIKTCLNRASERC
jgi:hypothetical protein